MFFALHTTGTISIPFCRVFTKDGRFIHEFKTTSESVKVQYSQINCIVQPITYLNSNALDNCSQETAVDSISQCVCLWKIQYKQIRNLKKLFAFLQAELFRFRPVLAKRIKEYIKCVFIWYVIIVSYFLKMSLFINLTFCTTALEGTKIPFPPHGVATLQRIRQT